MLGGSTTFLCNLAGELVRRKVPAEIFSFSKDNPLAADFQRLNVPVFCQDDGLIFEDRLAAIWRELQRFKPTVVIANISAISFEVLRYVPQGVFRCGVIHTDSQGVYDSLKHYAPTLDAMAVVSQKIQANAKVLPEFANVTVAYLPLGVPMPADFQTRTFDEPLRILYLGRLSREQKRVHLLPEILEYLKVSRMPFHWTIAGDGPDASALRAAMQSNDPNQTISFLGHVAYDNVPAIIKDHDVFLLASDYEGLPLTLLEAMGHGLIPVVSDLPSGIREVVNESNGVRVSPDDIKGYAEAILTLNADRRKMAELSLNARNKVRTHFSVGAMADRWLNAFPDGKSSPDTWPGISKYKPILGSTQSYYFSPPVRMLRRLAARFRR